MATNEFASGLSEARFLGAFSSPDLDTLSAGMVSELFRRSFPFAAVDLARMPFQQVFAIHENVEGTAAGVVSQIYRVYVSRALNGPAADDCVTAAFAEA